MERRREEKRRKENNSTYSSSRFLPPSRGASEVRPRPAGDEQVHGDSRVGRGEVEREVLGQRPDGGLARVVGRVARRVRDALLAPRDDDGGRRGRRFRRFRTRGRGGRVRLLHERKQCRDPVYHAKEVRRQDLLEPGRVRVVEGRPGRHTRV